MMKRLHWALAFFLVGATELAVFAQNPNSVVYQGDSGPGKGKHIVMIAGDHEYRSEEVLPALGRILAKHHGFKSSVFFTTDAKDGTIKPGSSHISGLEALKTADLLVVGLRFQNFKKDQMQHFVDYIDSGRPVIGIRTSTHAFKIGRNQPFAKYSWNYSGKDYHKGFGRQVLGETWVSHYGGNHRQSSLLLLQKDQADHPVLRGVKDVWAQSGGYTANPMEGSKILALGQILNGMKPTAEPAKGKKLMPVAWVRQYKSASGKSGRVFTTTHCASEDIENEGFRRMMVNACFWAIGLEEKIKPDLEIGFVGPYDPSTFRFGGYRKGVKPADLAGWDSPIMPPSKSKSSPAGQKKKKTKK